MFAILDRFGKDETKLVKLRGTKCVVFTEQMIADLESAATHIELSRRTAQMGSVRSRPTSRGSEARKSAISRRIIRLRRVHE